MAKPRYGKTSAPPGPANAAEGAAHIRAAAVKLYDRQDGTGVDWRMVTEALFRAAFDTLDKLPDDACRSVARRVHEGSYGRMTDELRAGSTASRTSIDPDEPPASTTIDATMRAAR